MKSIFYVVIVIVLSCMSSFCLYRFTYKIEELSVFCPFSLFLFVFSFFSCNCHFIINEFKPSCHAYRKYSHVLKIMQISLKTLEFLVLLIGFLMWWIPHQRFAICILGPRGIVIDCVLVRYIRLASIWWCIVLSKYHLLCVEINPSNL